MPFRNDAYKPEKGLADDHEKEGAQRAEAFLAFRQESARALNEEICEPFLEGTLSDERIAEYFAADAETAQLIRLTLESFAKPRGTDRLRRKDGSPLAAHSLQLFLSARDFFNIKDNDVLRAVLVHDIIEDTAVSRQEIATAAGERAAELAEAMTEEGLAGPLPDLPAQDLVRLSQARFARKLAQGGATVAAAEIIDRADDVSDTEYVTNALDGSAAALTKAKEKFIYKFAKCLYTIETVCAGQTDPTVRRLAGFPAELIAAKRAEIGKGFGITVTDAEIVEEIGKFISLEKI